MGVRVSALTVRELNQRVQEILSASFGPELWVVGELHGVKHHAKSGHVYFDLVEKAEEQAEGYIARISCAFFRGAFVRWQTDLKRQGLTGFDLKDGLEVKLRARLDLFVKEGRYQLVVQGIDPGYSLGAMAQRRARTIAFLRQAHLMERNKALPLPVIPLEIGLITSAGSAAYNDFMSIISKSGFAFRVTLLDAYMQGVNTPREVSAGVPMRTPEVYQAPFGSRGIELRLVTTPESSRADSAWRPVRPNEVVTSSSTRWLSVPSVTSFTPRFIRPSASALALSATSCA